MRRPLSLVSTRAMTQNVISPGFNVATPAVREISSQRGGRIEETLTRFCCSMSASRKANSKAVSACLWTPTPRVRKTLLGMGNKRPSDAMVDHAERVDRTAGSATFDDGNVTPEWLSALLAVVLKRTA
jgi:hypothetical protein